MAKFRTSARTVDMLGRQQIAGIPTAISELFKNSYDAYATDVRVDYFQSRRILILRDNGIGMSTEDFLDRWLTVGTDSKTPGSIRSPLPSPDGIPTRRPMGEKGIGRLAIASIGPTVLAISRAAVEAGGTPSYVVALVPWSLFETPGLTLDEIEIPVETIDSLSEVDEALIKRMQSMIVQNTKKIGASGRPIDIDRIERELSALDIDPQTFLGLEGPDLNSTSGTAFILTSVYEDLDFAMAEPAEGDGFSPFQRFLSGFSNTMIQSETKARIATRFYMHTPGQGAVDLISPNKFWESSDFDSVDHLISGEFDEFGTFHGSVSVYQGEPTLYTEAWPSAKGNRTRCGPFRVQFGIVQGERRDSKLPAEEWSVMTKKLNGIGGLYVYRDGIRVLPYGNSDVDYLEIEQRRTKNAGTYYFSHRRMFGAVALESSSNPGLQEKAGREGFRENGAYRDFTGILKNFLVQVAASFFNVGGEQADIWETERDRLKKRATARSKKEAQERKQLAQFANLLGTKLDFLENGSFESEIANIVSAFNETFSSLNDHPPIPVESIEERVRGQFGSLRASVALKKPDSLALTTEIERDFNGYLSMSRSAESFALKTEAEILERLENAFVVRAGASPPQSRSLDRHARVLEDAETRLTAFESEVRSVRGTVQDATSTLSAAASVVLTEFEQRTQSIVDQIDSDTEVTATDERDRLLELENAYADASTRLDAIRLSLASAIDGNAELADDNRVLRERVLDLEERIDEGIELMQLGQAVQVISHEFDASIRSVRDGLRRLGPWAKQNRQLAGIVRDLRGSFEHLDGYLRLFTPLQRRLYRSAVAFTGQELAEFCFGLFSDRLKRHRIDMHTTEEFLGWQIVGYPSSFYPAFVNVIDNAIYWVSTVKDDGGRIEMGADEHGMLISDNGPGVRGRDRESVFERGFTRRRGGRGLGLALSRDLLTREGWDLTLESDGKLGGATFRLAPIEAEVTHDSPG